MSNISENERGFENFLNNHPSCRCRNNSPEPGGALLSCGSGGIGPISSTTLSAPMSIATVSIDTRRLCNPRILLTFTCSISLPVGIGVNLNFIIVKSTDCGAAQAIGGTHTFSEQVSPTGVLEAESFCFQHCDCNSPAGSTTYTVLLDANSIVGTPPFVGLTINNATLSALAVETL
jgi:hypothetical protein